MTREQIQAIIDSVTGAPVTGLIADMVPGIVDALDAALNPARTDEGSRQTRVIEADETR